MKLPSSRTTYLLSSMMLLSTLCFWTSVVKAEGSRTMVQDGGDRPYTEWGPNGNQTAGIDRKTLLEVYVEAGETVYFGSSVPASFSDPNDIVIRTPSGSTLNFDVESGGSCFIDTYDKETSGPANVGIDFDNDGSTTDGYTPCVLNATETWIYEVEFHAPSDTVGNSNPPDQSVTAPLVTGSNQRHTVSAWDITVVDGSEEKLGRVFTKYVAMNMGGNNRSLNSDFFIQTKDGYRYRTEMNGIDPFGFLFFSNNRGFIDNTDNSTLYHSAIADNNELTAFRGNVVVQRPDVPDTATDLTHLIFFNRPDADALNFLGIPTQPVIPAQPENFQFIGGNGNSGNQTPVDVGGNFTFDSVSEGSYQIIIDTNSPGDNPSNGEFNPDGIFDPTVDIVLQNPAFVGSNVVSWNGRDQDGNVVPPRDTNISPYEARITLRVGEYHFPILDAETNTNGIIIELENAPAPFPTGLTDTNGNPINEFTIYYDDSNYTTANGDTVILDGGGETSPRNAALGVDSNLGGGAHGFGTDYGDRKGIDTWTFFPSEPTQSNLVITPAVAANVEGIKSVRFLTDADSNGQVTIGDRVEYRITYSNLDTGNTSDAIDFIISDALPSQLTFESASIISQTPGNTITLNPSYNGSGALTNSGTLRTGDTIEIAVQAVINDNNSEVPIENQASAAFSTPDSIATVGTVVTDADSNGGVSQTPAEGQFFSQTNDDTLEGGNNPQDSADDDPTLITVVATPPQILLVKRITQVNGVDLTGFDDNDGDTKDNNALWPTPKSEFLRGQVEAEVEPGDIVEYTIYYLSSGGQNARTVTICDLVPDHQTFVTDAFNDEGGGPNFGIAALILEAPLGNPPTPNNFLSNIDGDDQGTFFPAGTLPPTRCKKEDPPGSGTFVSLEASDNEDGLVVVDVVENPDTLPAAYSAGTPPTSYGFIRFRATVD